MNFQKNLKVVQIDKTLFKVNNLLIQNIRP
jgi:hypothetical protein